MSEMDVYRWSGSGVFRPCGESDTRDPSWFRRRVSVALVLVLVRGKRIDLEGVAELVHRRRAPIRARTRRLGALGTRRRFLELDRAHR
jgi:hypothetical protein